MCRENGVQLLVVERVCESTRRFPPYELGDAPQIVPPFRQTSTFVLRKYQTHLRLSSALLADNGDRWSPPNAPQHHPWSASSVAVSPLCFDRMPHTNAMSFVHAISKRNWATNSTTYVSTFLTIEDHILFWLTNLTGAPPLGFWIMLKTSHQLEYRTSSPFFDSMLTQ